MPKKIDLKMTALMLFGMLLVVATTLVVAMPSVQHAICSTADAAIDYVLFDSPEQVQKYKEAFGK